MQLKYEASLSDFAANFNSCPSIKYEMPANKLPFSALTTMMDVLEIENPAAGGLSRTST